MKKAKLLVLLLFIVVGITACKKEEKTSTLTVVTEPEYADQVKEAVNYYMEKHEGSKVAVDVLPANAETRESSIQKLRTETMSGKGPDVFLLGCQNVNVVAEEKKEPLFANVVQTMKGGAFASLDSYMKKDAYWESDQYEDIFLKAGQSGGRQYVLPLSCSYYAYLGPEETQPMGDTSVDWLDYYAGKEEMTGVYQNALWTYLTQMSSQWEQPALDYEKDEVLYDAENWVAFAEKNLSNYEINNAEVNQETADVTITMNFHSIEHLMSQSVMADTPIICKAMPNLSGRKMAEVRAYGAVGMSSSQKDQAYEFLMLFLTDEIQKEKAKEEKFTDVEGYLGIDGVPVQKWSWEQRFEDYIIDESIKEEALLSFQELDGTYFVTEADWELQNKMGEILYPSEQRSEEQEYALIREAAEAAAWQYQTIAKE